MIASLSLENNVRPRRSVVDPVRRRATYPHRLAPWHLQFRLDLGTS